MLNDPPWWTTVAQSPFFLSHCICFCVTVVKLSAFSSSSHFSRMHRGISVDLTTEQLRPSGNFIFLIRRSRFAVAAERNSQQDRWLISVPQQEDPRFPLKHTHTHKQTLSPLHTPPLCVLTHTHFPNTGNASG